MEIGTILVGLIALCYIRFSFLTFSVALALWFMCMDIAPLMIGGADIYGFTVVPLVIYLVAALEWRPELIIVSTPQPSNRP